MPLVCMLGLAMNICRYTGCQRARGKFAITRCTTSMVMSLNYSFRVTGFRPWERRSCYPDLPAVVRMQGLAKYPVKPVGATHIPRGQVTLKSPSGDRFFLSRF
jgi:hypothetical protein